MRHNDRRRMDEMPSASGSTRRESSDPDASGEVDTSRARDAALVAAALAGDESAFGRLYDGWYDRVWNVARRVVHDPEVAAEVAQDAFLSAWRSLGTLEDPDAFGGWLLRIARNASFNRQRKEARSTPVDDQGFAVIESTGESPVSAPAGFGVEDRARAIADPERVAGDAELVTLVRESATAMGERDAEVLDLQLRYGLSPAEIGEVMGMNRNAANQLCHRVRQRFAAAVRARVLWRGDRPACDALDRMLTSAGISEFDTEAVKMADKHADSCPQCSDRRDLRLQPSALFAAVPLVAAPVLLKQQTAHALEAAGVAMDGSEFGSGDGHGSDGHETKDGPRRAPRRARVAGMVAVAAVVLVAAVVALASRTDDATLDELEVAASSSLTTTTSTSTPTTIAVAPPESTQPELVAPEPVPTPESTEPPSAAPPPPPDPGPAPVSINLSLTPSQAPTSYLGPDFPVLSWSVADAASVRVEGPLNGAPALLSTAAVGQTGVCPGAGSATFCNTPPGPYTYLVRAFDADGIEVARRAVTLVIS